MPASNNLIGYAGAAQLTCSLASLATGSTRESATTSNASAKDFDYLVACTFTLASGTPSGSAAVNLYAVGSVDGTIWPIIQLSSGAVKATGAGDASIGAVGLVPNVSLIGSFGVQTTSSSGERTFRTEAYSVAAGFGGSLPPAFSLFVEIQTGVAFSASTATTANYLQINGVLSSSGN